jgi:hypothetical protein
MLKAGLCEEWSKVIGRVTTYGKSIFYHRLCTNERTSWMANRRVSWSIVACRLCTVLRIAGPGIRCLSQSVGVLLHGNQMEIIVVRSNDSGQRRIAIVAWFF